MSTPPPQIAPFVFSEPQERALNDALGRVTSTVTSTTVRSTFTAEAASITLALSQLTATYGVAIDATWWTMFKVASKTTTKLVLEFSSPAAAGDVITVTLT